MADQQSSQVKLENKTEHVLHINVGGNIVSVPPTVGEPLTVTFEDAEERQRFEAALQTHEVQSWMRDGHLAVHGGGQPAAKPQQDALQPGAQQPGVQQPGVPGAHDTTPSSPASKAKRGDRE